MSPPPLTPKQAFRLAYGFLRADGRVPWQAAMAPYRAAAFQAWSDRVWNREDPLHRARTRRTYAMIDLHTDRELNGGS